MNSSAAASLAVTSTPLPLTTVFTPPTSCLQNLESVPYATDSGTTAYYFHLGYIKNTACMPSGWSPSSYFSPGICPSGYSVATQFIGITNQTTETRGYCCPTRFTYVSGKGPYSTEPCASWLNVSSTTAASTSDPSKVNAGIVNAFAVSVRWNSGDFSTTLPHSKGEHAPLSTGVKAGIGIGVITGVLVIMIIGLTIFLSRRKRSTLTETRYTSIRHSSNEGKVVREEEEEEEGGKELSSKKDSLTKLSTWSAMGFDSWLYESIATCLSIACFIAILCILQAYDGKLSPELPHGLRLNTIVSVLATASKSSLLFVVGECISQLRWVSLQKSPKSLALAQTYDSASRGPWGSLIVMFKDKGRSFVTIGALVMVLALAFDPFVQQIISYPLRETYQHSRSTMVPQSRYLLPSPSNDTPLEDAMNAGVWVDDFPLSFSCPTGNCTWPQFRSIEMCSKCADVTSDARLSGWNVSAFNYSLKSDQTIPGTLSLSHGNSADMTIQVPYGQLMPDDFILRVPKNIFWVVNEQAIFLTNAPNYTSFNSTLGIKDPLIVVAYAQMSLPETWPQNISHPLSGIGIEKVTKCALSLCSRKYDISVHEGSSSVSVLDEDFGSFYIDATRPWSNIVCWKPSASPISNWTSYGDTPLDNTMIDEANFEFCGVQADFYAATFPLSGYSGWVFQTEFNNGTMSWMHDSFKDGLKSTFEIKRVNDFGLERIMHTIALSVSQLARQSSDSPVFGVAATMESYVDVVWPWLALPAVLLLSTIIFLFSTAVTTSRRQVNLWKSSIFPFLFHGLENGVVTSSVMTAGTSKNGQCESVSEMEQVANKLTVDLGLSKITGRTMLRGTPEKASSLLHRESRRQSF